MLFCFLCILCFTFSWTTLKESNLYQNPSSITWSSKLLSFKTLHLFVSAIQCNISSLWHFDCLLNTLKTSRIVQVWKKIISKDCYVHHLVTKMDTAWSNSVSTAQNSCLTMVGYGSLDKIMLSDHGWIWWYHHHHLPPWVRSFDLFRHRCVGIVS